MTAIHLCARYGHVNILDALDGHVNWRITSKKVKINEDFDELCKRKCQRIRRKKTCVFMLVLDRPQCYSLRCTLRTSRLC